MNLADILTDACLRYPGEPALLVGTANVTYVELLARVRRLAGLFVEHGVGRGDRVGVLLPNVPEFTESYFATLWLGAVVVPLSILLSAGEVQRALSHAGCRFLVTDDDIDGFTGIVIRAGRDGEQNEVRKGTADFTRAEDGVSLEGPATVSADETAVIFYTSGTTGTPRGAQLTHLNLFTNAQWVSERSLARPDGSEAWGPGHISLAALPFSHSFGQTCVQNATLFNGGAICFYATCFDAREAALAIDRNRVTLLAAVPSMIHAILNESQLKEGDLTSLRYCLIGGAPIPRPLVEALESQARAEVLEGYGLSETSPVITFRTAGCPRKWGSVGRAIDGVDLRIVGSDGKKLGPGESGEVAVKGDPVMKGYLDAPGEPSAFRDGWFLTGDIGYLDEEQNLFLVDRKKDIILRGGYTVYPAEVEGVLSQHPGVAESAVVGAPDPALGEEVVAYVIPCVVPPLNRTPSGGDLIAWTKARLARYKYPRRIVFREQLPKGTKGQVLKHVLRHEAFVAGETADVAD